MAKKGKKTQGYTEPQGFTHGMISDVDPHFQLTGSYSDAQNIRLTNSEGNTFTVENIEGNSLFVDLGTISPYRDPSYENSDGTFAGPDYIIGNGRLNDFGPNGMPYTTNLELHNRASIVGHVSYANQILLIIVARYSWKRNNPTDSWGDNIEETHDRTLFWLLDFDNDFNFTKATDLEVCFSAETQNYPDLNMDIDTPIRIEHMIENGCISRIYWTDNKNPLRTLNLNQIGKNKLSIENLNITPLMSPSQPVLHSTISGSLPVGVYQYAYKYISENGGESTFSPLSNLYHVSDKAFGSSLTYSGGPKGNIGSQGFNINIYDVDQNFDYVELYSLFYEDLNNAPRVSIVNRSLITNSLEVSFTHVGWNNELESGLEEILIDTNTWDICKDIAIKDNILFAANLKQKRNWISEKEWNVKVMRFCLLRATSSSVQAMLTTNDPNVKHYNGSGVITEGSADDDGNICGHGQILGGDGTIFDVVNNSHLDFDENIGNPMWTTAYNQRHGNHGSDNRVKTKFEFRYLSDKMTLGAESFDYTTNALGGCRVTFGISQREADQTQNTNTSPFISATTSAPEDETFEDVPFATDNIWDYKLQGNGYEEDNTNTSFQTSIAIGGTKDPHAAGDRRGYQRGEVYRFGVQVYDLNGTPGNVLWIGDIQMPEQYDPLRMLKTWKNDNTSTDYSPRKTTTELVNDDLLTSHQKSQDHRLSYVYGHVVPPCEVEWFTSINQVNHANYAAYVDRKGDPPNSNVIANQTVGGLKGNSGRVKGITIGPFRDTGVKDYFDMYESLVDVNNTHYLFDLFVHFEFQIPEDVCKKISGFRVVRAERKEQDRRVTQQGLLNQTAQYGNAEEDLSYGYDETNFSAADNKAFDDDPVFVNQLAGDGEDPTGVEQPEYNTYLNGYLGLAENSFMAWCDTGFDRSSNDPGGKVTTGGNTEGLVYYHPEAEDAKKYENGKNSYAIPNHRDTSSQYGPGMIAKHHRHCGYFGGLDKLSFKDDTKSTDESWNYSNNNVGRTEISGSVFTLDSPDSAFGIRPYIFKSGDMLRIDCVMKLSDSERYKSLGAGFYLQGYWGHNINTGSTGNWSGTSGDYHSEEFNTGLGMDPIKTAYAKDKSIQDSLRFCARQDINDDYGVLIGKYYCWDTGYAINQELNGGKSVGDHKSGSDKGDRPHDRGMWLSISNSKEISDGEIVPAGFFKNSRKVKKGRAYGFSNNTLGFVKTRITQQHACYIFGSVDERISRYNGEKSGDIFGSGYDTAWDEDKQIKDFNYDTVSTMQMGLRSILIELNTEIKTSRKRGPGDTDSYFLSTDLINTSTAEEFLHDAWFSPQNFSVIYDQGNWIGYKNNGTDPSWNHRGTSDANLCSHHEDNTTVNSWTNTGGFDESVGYNKTGQISDGSRTYHPHAYLCSIIRKVTPYGGHNKSAIESTRYISCGNFHPVKHGDPANFGGDPGAAQAHTSKVFGGDTFVNLYSHQKTSTPYMKKSMARWKVFPVESYVNTDMRSGLNLNNGDLELGKEINKAPYSNDWLYNSVYSQENTIKSGIMIDEDLTCENLDLPYEIAYSNTKVSGEPGDAFRSFPINQFHDMEGLYGEINRLVNFKNEIYVLQDSAFAKLLVNPISMLSDDTGTSLFTGTGETVENHIYISTKYGTRQRFSVVMSEKSLYFVDTNYARLFKYDTEKLISLGDALGQRNYLKNIIKEWEVKARRDCTRAQHNVPSVNHGTYKGRLDSLDKKSTSRNYFADNPLKFLGVTSIFDHKNKELMVTFHNSVWQSAETSDRLTFADPYDNHTMGSSIDGRALKISETLVYNESVNAFTSKYSVAPPQWLTGSQGSFILCPENEIDVRSISQIGTSYEKLPYDIYGTQTTGLSGIKYGWSINHRPNPLRLWLWDKHIEGKKTNFFGKKDDVLEVDESGDGPLVESPVDENDYESHMVIKNYGTKYVADESYIEKVINDEAGVRKVFDNVRVIMTPSDVPFYNEIGYSFADFSTETSGDQHAVIKNRWEFQDGPDGWNFWDGTENASFGTSPMVVDPQSQAPFWSGIPPGFGTGIIPGCTDSTALNYNINATANDGSCYYGSPILGCTNSTATNYNSNANINDGSCVFAQTILGCTDPGAENFNSIANTDDGSCFYLIYGCTDPAATNYNSLVNANDGSCMYIGVPVNGCTDSTATNYNPAATIDDASCIYPFYGCTDPTATNYDLSANTDDGSCIYPVNGCTSPSACNYDSNATTDDGTCCYIPGCTDLTATNYDATACCDDGSCTYTSGCTDSNAFNYDPTATIDDGSCIPIVTGCTDSTALNYDPSANVDDSSCLACIYGCMDSGAFNYDSAATCDDSSCVPIVNGCTDSLALNYNTSANTDDGTCTYCVYGCTDPTAINYDTSATCDDNSCTYTTGCTDPGASNYDPNATTDDGSCIACVYGCTDSTYIEYDPNATCDDGSSCLNACVYGCTDSAVSNYNSAATCDDGNCCVDGCTDTSAFNYNSLATCDDSSCQAVVLGCTDSLASNYNSNANTDDNSCITCTTYGCTDSTALNYDPAATCDDGSCIYCVYGCTDSIADNYNPLATCDDGSCIYGTLGCTDPTACNYHPNATIDDGSCTGFLGCTSPTACNYNVSATCDDGSCSGLLGCTDSTAINYNSSATCDDGSCLTSTSIPGCTDSLAINYNPLATIDDGSCVYCVYGCTDSTGGSTNYNPLATCDDGSCIYGASGCTDPTALNYDSNATVDDGSCIYTAPTGSAFSGIINGSGNTAVCVSSRFSVTVFTTQGYGSHYDPTLNYINATWENEWQGVTTTHNASFLITHWRDLDNGITLDNNNIGPYVNGTGNYAGNPHPNINWGIRSIRLFNTSFNSMNPTGCTWVKWIHWRSGSAASVVTAATPTNPYNLP